MKFSLRLTWVVVAISSLAIAGVFPGGEQVRAADQPNSVADSLAKLAQEVKALKDEIRQLRQRLDAPFSPALPDRKGEALFPDGKKLAFDGLAGIRDCSPPALARVKQRVVGHLILEMKDGVHEVPLDGVAGFDIGKKDEDNRLKVVVRTRDGRKQEFNPYYYDFELDIKWSGEISVVRMHSGNLEGVSFRFEK